MNVSEERSGDRDPSAHAREYLEQFQQDSWHQAERHVEQAGFWENFSWVTGGISAALAAAASGTAFSELPVIAGTLALLAAGAGALATALRPGELSAAHMKAAAQYHLLQQSVTTLLLLEPDPIQPRRVTEVSGRWDEITIGSPRISQRLVRKVNKRLNHASGMHYYPKPLRTGPLT